MAAAQAKCLYTAVDLQARSAPIVRYLAHLVAEGYVGEVLSTTLVASGGQWGAAIPDASVRYLYDRSSGATMLTIPFAHAIDAVSFAIGEPTDLRAILAVRRATVLDVASGERVQTTAADQIAIVGLLSDGAVLSAHFRGGESRATNLRWEINGTEGDLVIEGPGGNLQMLPLTLAGGRNTDREVSPIDVPDSYHRVPALDGDRSTPAYNVAHVYTQLREDLLNGLRVVPDFEHAMHRHQTIQAVLDDVGAHWSATGA